MGEFRHREERLLLVVQVISYSLCNYMYSNLSVRVVLSHFPMVHVPYPCGLIQELYLEQIMVPQRYAALRNNLNIKIIKFIKVK
jgi:hypothetical protein